MAGGNTAVGHDTRQSSRGVSVTIVYLGRVGSDELEFRLKGGDLHLQYACVVV